MDPVIGLSAEANDGQSPGPIGGRLLLFRNQWATSTSDSWVLRTISQGLTIEFMGRPPSRFLSGSIPSSPDLYRHLSDEISHLLEIRAIEPVPESQRHSGFYSTLFLVPKNSGGWRAILNLKGLNLSVHYRRFKMHSLRSILAGVRRGDFLQSVDLREAYLHVPVHSRHRKYLRFEFQASIISIVRCPSAFLRRPAPLRSW